MSACACLPGRKQPAYKEGLQHSTHLRAAVGATDQSAASGAISLLPCSTNATKCATAHNATALLSEGRLQRDWGRGESATRHQCAPC
jgi:hypothetical protein